MIDEGKISIIKNMQNKDGQKGLPIKHIRYEEKMSQKNAFSLTDY